MAQSDFNTTGLARQLGKLHAQQAQMELADRIQPVALVADLSSWTPAHPPPRAAYGDTFVAAGAGETPTLEVHCTDPGGCWIDGLGLAGNGSILYRWGVGLGGPVFSAFTLITGQQVAFALPSSVVRFGPATVLVGAGFPFVQFQSVAGGSTGLAISEWVPIFIPPGVRWFCQATVAAPGATDFTVVVRAVPVTQGGGDAA